MFDPTSSHAPSASGYTAQNPPENPAGSQGSAVPQTENTTRYVQARASEQAATEQAATSGKNIAERRSGRANPQRDSSRFYRTKDLLEWANASNHPDTIKALKECRISASASYAEPGEESLKKLPPREQLNLLKQHLGEKQPKATNTDTKACHVFNAVQKSFGTPVQLKLSVNRKELELNLTEQSRLVNDVVLDEVADRLKGISKPGRESKWKGDLERSDIALQVETQDKTSGDRWIVPIHSVNPDRKSIQKTPEKKSSDHEKSVEIKEKELTEKLQSVIPGSIPTLKDTVRQDTLNPVYLFITEKLGITPSSSTQTYSVEVTAINRGEFRVENKAQFTKYSKTGVKKNYDGNTTILVQSHFKRDNGQFVPAGLSVDIDLDNIKPKHLPDEPKMKRAQSAEALNCERVGPAASFNLSPPAMRRQIPEQHNFPVKLGITFVEGQLYAMNMAASDLKHLVNEKTALTSYKKSLTDDLEQWENLPAASSMSIPCPLKQTTTQLSKLNTHAPTSGFFKGIKSRLSASDASTRRTMEQVEAAYKKRWLEKATELTKASSDSMYTTAISLLPPMTLQGEKVEQFMKLSGILGRMNREMVRLAEKAEAAKRSFSRQELTQEQLLSKLLKIKLESSKHLKKLRESGCEFSSLCEQYGFYKGQKPTEGHEVAIQYLEKKKTLVMLEEKKVGLSVMQTIVETENSGLPGTCNYDDLTRFINNPMAFDPEGESAAMVLRVLKDESAARQCKLFSEGSFRDLGRAKLEAGKKLIAMVQSQSPLSLAHKRIIQHELDIELQPLESKKIFIPSEPEIIQLAMQKLHSNPYYYETKLDNIIHSFDTELC